MMDENLLYKKIEKYIEGTMDKEELKKFKEELARDPNLVEEVKLHQDIGIALTETDVIDFEKKISTIFESTAKEMEKEGKVFSIRRMLSIAASILLLVTAGYFIFNFNKTNPSSVADLVQEKFSFSQNISEGILNENKTKGINEEELKSEIKNTWRKTVKEFKKNNFVAAISLFDEIERMDNQLQNVSVFKFHYFRGVAYLKQNQPEKAFNAFDKINKNIPIYGNDAYWNKILCLLLIPERKQDGIDYLETIAASNDSRKKVAKEILDKL